MVRIVYSIGDICIFKIQFDFDIQILVLCHSKLQAEMPVFVFFSNIPCSNFLPLAFFYTRAYCGGGASGSICEQCGRLFFNIFVKDNSLFVEQRRLMTWCWSSSSLRLFDCWAVGTRSYFDSLSCVPTTLYILHIWNWEGRAYQVEVIPG